jgi:hypothetical protein
MLLRQPKGRCSVCEFFIAQMGKEHFADGGIFDQIYARP